MTGLIIFLIVVFAVITVVLITIKKEKKLQSAPPPPITIIKPTPEIIPTPLPPIVNEFCYSHQVAISDSYDTICQSETYITVYNLIPNSCDEPCQFFLTEDSCKRNMPSWNSANTYVRCGTKFSYIDANGFVRQFEDCISK